MVDSGLRTAAEIVWTIPMKLWPCVCFWKSIRCCCCVVGVVLLFSLSRLCVVFSIQTQKLNETHDKRQHGTTHDWDEETFSHFASYSILIHWVFLFKIRLVIKLMNKFVCSLDDRSFESHAQCGRNNDHDISGAFKPPASNGQHLKVNLICKHWNDKHSVHSIRVAWKKSAYRTEKNYHKNN